MNAFGWIGKECMTSCRFCAYLIRRKWKSVNAKWLVHMEDSPHAHTQLTPEAVKWVGVFFLVVNVFVAVVFDVYENRNTSTLIQSEETLHSLQSVCSSMEMVFETAQPKRSNELTWQHKHQSSCRFIPCSCGIMSAVPVDDTENWFCVNSDSSSGRRFA